MIIVGGILITRRLHLLGLAAAFWLTLAAGLGLLAASGHCMVANWAFAPVCGADFWRVIVTSPEVLIFLFFMITDPKTVPAGSVGRIVFGVLVAVTSVLLMAPQTDEFGTKVGLLAGLVVVCAMRPLLDRFLPAAHTAADDLRAFVRGGTDAPARRDGGARGSARWWRRAAGGGRHRGGRHSGARDRGAGSGGGPEQPAGRDRSHHAAADHRRPGGRSTTTTSSPDPACRPWW